MNYLGIDAGTTYCKGVLFSENGKILASESRSNDLKVTSDGTYIDIELIFENVKSILKSISEKYRIDTVAFTSLGESFAALDENDTLIFPPMIYSDPRGTEQAERIAKEYPENEIFGCSGVMPNAMYSLYKLLWWKENRPKDYKKISKILLVGDYLAYRLTGERVIDRSLAARTGALDVKTMKFSEKLLSLAEVGPSMFSKVVPAGTVIGKVIPEISSELGINRDCLVVAGSHDQICSALGSGVVSNGIGVDGMGTVECIVAAFEGQVTDPEMGKKGYPCVPFVHDGMYVTYLLNYTCGGVMKWYESTLFGGRFPEGEKTFYSWCEKGIDASKASGMLLLPYFRGAATPYNDIYAKGALIGLTCDCTPQELCRAIMEGTSYEMKLNLETMEGYGRKLSSLVCTGGCSRSDAWMQIKANILEMPVKRVSNVEAGSCGAAMLGAVATGRFKTLREAADVFVTPGKTFTPYPDESFRKQYEKYKKLYLTVKELM